MLQATMGMPDWLDSVKKHLDKNSSQPDYIVIQQVE